MSNIEIYNNPFINRDANTDSVSDIVNYWCEPEHIELNDFPTSKKAIIIEGPRGCGKTTLFKFYSYEGQLEKGKSIDHYLKTDELISLYYRIGEYNYSVFKGKGVSESSWINIMTHIFELKLAKLLISMLGKEPKFRFKSGKSISDIVCKSAQFIPGFNDVNSITDFDMKLSILIKEVSDYVRKLSIIETDFKPKHWYESYEITNTVISMINNELNAGLSFSVAFIIDEMENLSTSNQRVINNYLKFVKENISFRLGSRPAGLRTLKTLSSENIRINHDYKLITIQPFINIEKYKVFLRKIANKRLESNYSSESPIHIEKLLGMREDLIYEINKKIPPEFDKHFDILNVALSDDEKNLIKSDNKLQELLNIVEINRGKQPSEINKQMVSFNSKKNKDSVEYKRYQNLYQNKYKKSLCYLLLNIAGERKSYYSLNTFAYLSSGSTRVFLQLCHKLFEIASYKCPTKLVEDSMIDIEIQDEAAKSVAEGELNYLRNVGPYGGQLFNFIDNCARLFRYYHRDKEMKYPETNQFTLADNINDKNSAIIDFARMHAFVIRKEKLQQRSIGLPKTNIYTLNRVYFPLYDISYVTRGGYIPQIDNESMEELVSKQIVNSSSIHTIINRPKNTDTEESKSEEEEKYEQIKLFDF